MRVVTEWPVGLDVLGLEPLDAPAVQVGVNGSEFTMQCSYDGVPAILWTTGSGSPRFSPLTLADEGNYTCGVLVSTGGSSRIFNRKILLLVEGKSVCLSSVSQSDVCLCVSQSTVCLLSLVPLRLIRHSEPVYHSLNHNRPVSLAVSFTGRVSHNLMVTWYHNNQALPTPDPRINTVLLESDPSSSTLAFPMVRRSDRGVYRVEVVTMVEENPARRLEQTFQLDITSKFDCHYPMCWSILELLYLKLLQSVCMCIICLCVITTSKSCIYVC